MKSNLLVKLNELIGAYFSLAMTGKGVMKWKN